MRKIRLVKFALVVVLGLTAIPSFVNAAMTDKPGKAAKGIRMTRHNLSNWGLYTVKATNETQVCIFCHAPHNADSAVAPLWNHVAQNPAVTFQMASTVNVSPNRGDSWVDSQPSGISKKCLSCHDGTVAIGALANGNTIPTVGGQAGGDVTRLGGTRTAGTGWESTGNYGYIGTDLRGGHVISFKYDNIFNSYSSRTKLRNRTDMSQYQRASMFDRDGKMQCHSCHDPHTDWCDDPNKTVGADPLWRSTNNNQAVCVKNSDLCEVCHKAMFSGYTQRFPY